jgi:hypothetical protein
MYQCIFKYGTLQIQAMDMNFVERTEEKTRWDRIINHFFEQRRRRRRRRK